MKRKKGENKSEFHKNSKIIMDFWKSYLLEKLINGMDSECPSKNSLGEKYIHFTKI